MNTKEETKKKNEERIKRIIASRSTINFFDLEPKIKGMHDIHHKKPRSEGGTNDPQNLEKIKPLDHMKKHGNYRERSEDLQALYNLVHDRNQIMRLTMKIENQIRAYKRETMSLNQETLDMLVNENKKLKMILDEKTKKLEKYMKGIAHNYPVVLAAKNVKGVSFVTLAYCLAYIDIEKANHATSLWKYAGIDKPAHERYQKGASGGGCKALRTALYSMADAQLKHKNNGSSYGHLYDNYKKRLENSDNLTKTRLKGGKIVEKPWKEVSNGHRHGAALRIIMKHFLADYWYVARTLAGLETTCLYPESHLGATHKTIMPDERGWSYKEEGLI